MIEFHHVSKQYPGESKPALHDISLSVDKGEFVFLAGPSGAGKSTLLKIIAAITRPSSGRIIINGQDMTRIKARALPFWRRNLGLVFQHHQLLTDRSILSNVMYPLIVLGESTAQAKERAEAALDKVNLLEKSHAMPLSLSGGEQQRAAIARAIVNRPQLILADEPTANLDRASANQVLTALKDFHKAGVTCLISTHDETLLNNAQRVIYLSQGKLSVAEQNNTANTEGSA